MASALRKPTTPVSASSATHTVAPATRDRWSSAEVTLSLAIQARSGMARKFRPASRSISGSAWASAGRARRMVTVI